MFQDDTKRGGLPAFKEAGSKRVVDVVKTRQVE